MPIVHKLLIYSLLNFLLIGPLGATTVEKSPNDRRDYAAITLENGLLVMLISDPNADQAAAAMDIRHGSWSEPAAFPGLAHLLEHMLFLGTEPFPENEEYQGFINRHGGSHNAYTSAINTNYFFSVNPTQLYGALERFAPFFYAPLLEAQYVAREKMVVDAEFQSKLQEENWRFWSLDQVMADPNHPASRFTIGNRDSLQDLPEQSLQQALVAFFRAHYTTPHMALVVLGRESTDELAGWVKTLFAPLASTPTPDLAVDRPRYTPPQFVEVQSLDETRRLSLRFPLALLDEEKRFHRPAEYVGELMGDEGPGSLLSLLKARGWAESLSAGGSENALEMTFSIDIELTPAGRDQVPAIVELVFQTLKLIADEGINDWRYAEMARLADISFQFQETIPPIRQVSGVASLLRRYGPERVLRVPYLYAPFDGQLIRDTLNQLTPQNLIAILQAPDVVGDRQTPYFAAAYRQSPPLTVDLTAPRHAALALPTPNEFIPANLALRDVHVTPQPERMARDGMASVLWYLHDNEFQTPRGDFFLSVQSPVASHSAINAMLAQLYALMVMDELNELTYPASVAGLDFNLRPHSRGMTLQLSGFDEKQPVLLEKIIAAITQPTLDPQRFARLREELLRRWRNAQRDAPYSQAMGELYNLVMTPSWSLQERLAATQAVDLAMLTAFVPTFLAELQLVQLAHGNFDADQAQKLAQIAEKRLLATGSPTTTPVPRADVLALAATNTLRLLPVDHNDGAIVAYYQGADRRYDTRAAFGLLAQMLETPFYQSLRTEQQLGYVVTATALPLLEVPGVGFIVQSPHVDGSALQQKIADFLVDFASELPNTPPDTFAAYQAGLLNRLQERDQTLSARSQRLWRSVDMDEPRFDTREQIAAAVSRLTLDDLVALYQTAFIDQPRQLSVLAVNSTQEPLAVTGHVISDGARFKARRSPVPRLTNEEAAAKVTAPTTATALTQPAMAE